ncbi:MAG TPA: PQQ-binding-like beta-propeller repeat protein [Terriglobales bacterium]|nr:PQQ-binding-like beta-propeller repeat protein [Terriglobales bacterium]
MGLLGRHRQFFAVITVSVLLGMGAGTLQSQDATSESRLEHADKEPQNWLTVYGNYSGWNYSPLSQISRKNVGRLVPVWAFPTGLSKPPLKVTGLDAPPLVVDGVLFIEGMQNNVYAVDAATGQWIWTYAYEEAPRLALGEGRGARGLAYGDGKIYIGTMDNHIVAIDAKTGKEVWNAHEEDPFECQCKITSAPLFVRGKVLTGPAGNSGGKLRASVNAYDAETGKRVWRFSTVLDDKNQSDPEYGGGAIWETGTYDPETNVTYWGTGDPSPAMAGQGRPGNNLYTASVVALDADTGQLKWYFQETPHDVYDYDSHPGPILLDLNIEGSKRKVMLHSSKNGFAYLLDRETGKFIRAFPWGVTPTWTKGLDASGQPIDPVDPGQVKEGSICPPPGAGAQGVNYFSYSPKTNLWYATDYDVCTVFTNGRRTMAVSPQSAPSISAFDPATGAKKWSFNTNYINFSSPLLTGGNLLFGGDEEGNAFALDATTGEKLWSFNTGSRISSAPVSFSVGGRQFIAISTGGGTIGESMILHLFPDAKGHLPEPSAMLFVFALPEKGK